MVKPIVHDPIFLSRKSSDATLLDMQTVKDLEDTLAANAEGCVGMAANMIGVLKNIIIFDSAGIPTVMINPDIVKKSGEYEAEEGCLSLTGVRKVKRYRNVTVQYLDKGFKSCRRQFTGYTAEIIQHEVDHCRGILI